MKVSTPGRICLFGEHQDYLGLPVIAAAISKRVAIEGAYHKPKTFAINLPDIGSNLTIELEKPLKYESNKDFFRAAIKVLKDKGYTFSKGFECTVNGNIPINSGTSSSSALQCSWINFLLQMSDQKANLTAKTIAEFSYISEVIEFNGAGGMMDQYSTAMGHVIYLESEPKIQVEFLSPKLGSFVLGDSQEPKDTQKILSWVKFGMLDIVKKITAINPNFNLHTFDIEQVTQFSKDLTADEFKLLKGNLDDRNILIEGLNELRKENINHNFIGDLLNRHQDNLRDAKKISTLKIDRMIDAALNAGALGAKINGSGGGGCMFAYAPTNAEKVAEAIESQGGKAYVIKIDEGTCIIN